MVSMHAFYSDNPSLNPAEVYRFNSVNCLKRKKINKKKPGMAHLKKTTKVTADLRMLLTISTLARNTIYLIVPFLLISNRLC